MNAVNAVPLLILVWTFTAVCQADDGDDISVSCENVTGTVGEVVNLTCSVSQSQKCTGRCIKMYKFNKNYKDSVICKEFPLGCEQRNSFTCSFTPTTAMTGQFRFFVQTQCGEKSSEFTVSLTEPIKPEPLIKDPGNEAKQEYKPETVVVLGSKKTFIPAVVGCFFIILFIIILLTILYKTQRIPVFLEHRHDDNNSNSPVNMI